MVPERQKGCPIDGRPSSGIATWSGGVIGQNSRPSYYRARYYDPGTGRFLSEDGQYDADINRYRYVFNLPTRHVDPLGMSPADVQKIINLVNQSIQNMTKNGERSGWGSNNLRVALDLLLGRFPRHLGCGEQADRTENDLGPLVKTLDNKWTPIRKQTYVPPHQWDEYHSDDPNDPIIVVDPFFNRVYTTTPLQQRMENGIK